MKKILVFAFAAGILLSHESLAQQDSTKHTKTKKNVIKVNLTATALYVDAPLIEYERVLNRNQSMSLQLGYVTLPFGSSSGGVKYQSDIKKSGFTGTVDYRFYLPRENKDPAPHGVYLAPFFSHYLFTNERNLDIASSSGSVEAMVLNSRLNLSSVGVELGYQFVLGKRWTIDCILFGPSYTHYNVKMQLTGNLPQDEIDENVEEILYALAQRYPFVGDLLEDDIAESSGKINTWNLGFRYSIHLGFRF
ncbi:MAG: DUF3575 domain-containing protein [Cyclobacteriaceae bacterium]|nr:DUF3575 domain-containing protein [Cyclobacteriaceae bacterium]